MTPTSATGTSTGNVRLPAGSPAAAGYLDPLTLATGLPPYLNSPISRAAHRMATPLLRVYDLTVLTVALFYTVVSYFLQQHHGGFASFLRLRVSVRNLAFEVLVLLVWRCIFWVGGLYQWRLNHRMRVFFWKVPFVVLTCTVVLIPVFILRNNDHELLRSCIAFWSIGTVLLLGGRAAIYAYEEHIRPAFRRRRTVLICGTGVRALSLAIDLPTHRDFKYQLIGFVDSDPQPDCFRVAPVLGTVDDLEKILMRQPIDEVIIALPVKSRFSEIEYIVGICGRAGIQTQYSLDIFTTDVAKNRMVDAAHADRVVLQMVSQDHRLYLKTTFDLVASALGLLLLSPLFFFIALTIKLTSPGPVFFVQERFGLGKRTFTMFKFRSMVVDAEALQSELEHLNETTGPTFKIKHDPRITPFGTLLRKTSLDELPQLINVLKGDMSLVGPRPLPVRDVDRFAEAWLMRRFSVKPGITGLWQVSGRSNTDFDSAIRLDLRYIDHWSILLDFQILAHTLAAVLKRSGAY